MDSGSIGNRTHFEQGASVREIEYVERRELPERIRIRAKHSNQNSKIDSLLNTPSLRQKHLSAMLSPPIDDEASEYSQTSYRRSLEKLQKEVEEFRGDSTNMEEFYSVISAVLDDVRRVEEEMFRLLEA